MDGGEIDTDGATVIELDAGDTGGEAGGERDFEAEARQHGWTPKEEFKGDASKWVDAETFAKRADEVMPFLKKQNTALKREIDDLKRTIKQASAHFSKTEERAYNRALSELQTKHDEAVETGDVRASRAVLKEMEDLKAEAPVKIDDDKPISAAEASKKLATWVDENDWYVSDAEKRAYADIQAGAMGPALEYDGGPDAWLEELGKRVSRKFATPKPNPVNGGGNRSGAKGGKSYADLPAAAKQLCDKWVKQGVIKSREDYVKSYDFGA